MKNKLNIIPSWQEKEKLWEEKAKTYEKSHPLKNLHQLPKMVGITSKTASFLRLKSLIYLLTHDSKNIFLRYFFKKPLRYGARLLCSYLQPKSFTRKEDLFFYGIQDEKEFTSLLSDEKTVVLVGFSYCHKPLECPSGRFTDLCINQEESPICSQCFIGKCSYLLSNTLAKIVYIPTIHYIGEKIFETLDQNPGKNVLFLITACEMSLQMFGDWGNMVQAKGIGIRLDGRICNTMQAFKLSEEGIKPGLTVVLDPTKEKILRLLAPLHKDAFDEKV